MILKGKPFWAAGFLPLLLVILALPCQAANDSPVGFVQTAKGNVQIISPNGEVRQGAYDLPISGSDVIKTGPASTTQVMFIDKTILALDENSEIAILDVFTPEKGGMFDLQFLTGTGRIITSAILSDNPEKFRAVTPLGTIGIRGTELGLLSDPDHEVVMLIEGGPVFYTDTQVGGTTDADQAELCGSLADALKKSEKYYGELKSSMNISAKNKVKKQISKIKKYQEEYKCAP